MKISKLFHWLYAFLMALPIFAVLSACLISTFNMSSKQESVIQYKYESNEVDSYFKLRKNNIYDFNMYFTDIYDLTGSQYYKFSIINGFIEISSNTVTIDDVISPLLIDENYVITIDLYSGFIYLYLSNTSDNYIQIALDEISEFDSHYCTIQLFDFSEGCDWQYFIYSDYNEIENVVVHNLDTQDIFYNAIDKVKQSPLFSWAYNSNILGVPISYIGGIFGLASNSIVNVLLCYWVAISIIWLVFDVLMFVPLLVHKSIDKMRF